MKRLALTLLGTALLAAPAQAAGGLAGRVDARFAPLGKGERPGAVVAVVRGGEVAHVGAYGYARLKGDRKMARDTVFDLASVSKQMTAMAIAMLAERGEIDLDAPMTTYLKGWPKWADKVTVRHLVHHTSGLPDYMDLVDWDGDHEPTSDEVAAMVAKQKKPVRPPGRKYEYSNSGYVALGRIVAKVSGQPFATFMRQSLFRPLGMKTARVGEGPAIVEPTHAQGHERKKKKGWKAVPRSNGDAVSGDGNVHATIDDMIAWTRAYQPGVLVKAATLKTIATPGPATGDGDTGYGFGLWIEGTKADRVLSHDGSWGGYATGIAMRPARKHAAIVLSNADDYEALAQAEALLEAL